MNDLMIAPSWGLDERHAAALRAAAAPGRRAEQWDLLPVSVLASIPAAVAAASEPAAQDQAARTAKALLGSYPRHAVEDPEIYSRAIVSVLQRFPPHIGARAVDALTLRCKFMPTRAELFVECEKLMAELRRTGAIATAMLQEHERRAQAEREAAERAESRAKMIDGRPASEVYADLMGRFKSGRDDA